MIGINPPQSKLVHSIFEPLPWQIEPWRDTSKVLVLTGSAGGGKSRFSAEKINGFMLKYPNATGLALRKAREFATKSIVPMMKRVSSGETELVQVDTIQREIIRSVPEKMVLADDVDYKKGELAFHYRHGGLLFIGGMKDDQQREAIRSIGQNGALDIAWMEEATAFTFPDFQELRPRMRGTAAWWRQIILSTNPDAPNHWINQKLIIGGLASVYYSGATDNTYNPSDYIDDLNTLEGIQYQRLVLGKWVQAEGVIYDNFTMDNVTDEAEYNPDWPVFWGVDDGYASGAGKGSESYHPRVFLLCQMTPQGGIHVFHEYLKTNELSEKSIQTVLDLPYKKAEIAYVDSSAQELLTRIREIPMSTVGATHKVSEGIKNVRRLVCDGNGQRLLKIHPRCVETINEFQSYRYDLDSRLVQAGEPKPLKENDHCMDALRYVCHKLRYT